MLLGSIVLDFAALDADPTVVICVESHLVAFLGWEPLASAVQWIV